MLSTRQWAGLEDLADIPALDAEEITRPATSFDDLDIGEIVDPMLLAPTLPYPPLAAQRLVHTCTQSNDHANTQSILPDTRLHSRSKSVGALAAALPRSPPLKKLPPIPSNGLTSEFIIPDGNHDASDLAQKSSTYRLSGDQFSRAETKPDSPKGVHGQMQLARTPESFLSMGESTLGCGSSATSEEEASQSYHTAPVSPTSVHSAMVALRPRPIPVRPHRHTRQSSSTSTLKMFFKRGRTEDVDNASDSETDSDALPTPTDSAPRQFRHKRGASFFKVLDRLKSST